MINNLNIKIFDYIFDTNILIKKNRIKDDKEYCKKLDQIIEEVQDNYSFWSEYQYAVNDDSVVYMGILGEKYIYNEFPKMKLNTLNYYYKYKQMQVKKMIENYGAFLQDTFEKITDNISNEGKKKILDICEEAGIIKYKDNPFLAADDSPAYEIFYDNIELNYFLEKGDDKKMIYNEINVNGNNNNLNNIIQSNLSVNDEELFKIILEKLDLFKQDGVDEKILEQLNKNCKEKNKSKIVALLRDLAVGAAGSILATGILNKFGLL